MLKAFNRDYPRVQIKLSSGPTVKLKKQYQQGLLDVVLTTEKTAGPGGRMISTQRLIWTGAEDGSAWKKRPVPLGISKNCAFRSSAIAALEDVDLEWIDVVASEDDTAALAMVSADLCISAELEGVKESGRVAIDHGGQMPELPEISIVLYSIDSPGNRIAQELVEYLLRAYS